MAQSKLMTKAIWKIVYYLVDEGIKIIEKARASKTTDNISGTQSDSYGLAIFYDGKLYYSLKTLPGNTDLSRRSRYIESTFDEEGGRHKGYGDIPDGYGREWAKMFIDEIKSSSEIPKEGFAMVVFNAAFYSSIQEKRQGYKILSQVIGDISDLGSKFKGSTLKGINITI